MPAAHTALFKLPGDRQISHHQWTGKCDTPKTTNFKFYFVIVYIFCHRKL